MTTATVQSLEEIVAKSAASKEFKEALLAFAAGHRTPLIEHNNGSPHAKALRAFIERVVKDYPEAASAIEYGFDCFAAVYPLPIWKAAMARSEQELQNKAAA